VIGRNSSFSSSEASEASEAAFEGMMCDELNIIEKSSADSLVAGDERADGCCVRLDIIKMVGKETVESEFE
jgi:hypothetical protein